MTITNSNIYKVPEIIPTATQISLNGHDRNNKEKKYCPLPGKIDTKKHTKVE